MTVYRQPFKNDWPITQKYGEAITAAFHTGIDYGCPEGTEILASADGIVMFSGFDKTGYGNCVIIRHDSEHSTLYAHLSEIAPAGSLNKMLKQGETIGLSGSTGNSTGPHLHFEARTQWNNYKTHFNPLDLPLMSVDDAARTADAGEAKELKGADGFRHGQRLKVAAPNGVWGHNRSFTSRSALPFPMGTEFEYSGQTLERNGLTFCLCYPLSDPVWIAVHDNDTQILESAE